MEPRIQIVAIGVAGLLLLGLLELVRQRRLLERYAVLWLLSALSLLTLAIWTGLLETLANLVGIVYAPSALFVFAFAFILVLLLHFSVAVSRLADQNKILAQKLALLEERERRGANEAPAEAGEAAEAAESQHRFERQPALRD
jgi:hypothetical protein